MTRPTGRPPANPDLPPYLTNPCGTSEAAQAHQRRGEDLDTACRTALTRYQRMARQVRSAHTDDYVKIPTPLLGMLYNNIPKWARDEMEQHFDPRALEIYLTRWDLEDTPPPPVLPPTPPRHLAAVMSTPLLHGVRVQVAFTVMFTPNNPASLGQTS